jgi:hypothetical protein
MIALSALWLPILLSSVLVFVASSVIHMVLSSWHKDDFAAVPDEVRMREALRPLAIPPGDYMIPRCDSMQEMKSPEFKAKMNDGPVMMFTMMPNGVMNMGRSLGLWFLYTIAIGIVAAYIASRALPPGAPYLRVFQLAGATAFVAYVGALWPMSIWYRRSWGTTIRSTIDGLVYALLTAGAFGWLWPH